MTRQPVAYPCPACGAELTIPWEQREGSVTCASCSTSRPFVDGVLVLEQGSADEDYPPSVYELLRRVEDRHFWFAARDRSILAALRDSGVRLDGATVLDIGCGTGHVLRTIERAGAVTTGTDMHIAGLRDARRGTRGLLICARGAPSRGAFDVVLLADVIEHVDDDRSLLRAARGALAPAGRILVTVPAHDLLWSEVDVASGHKRRYSRASLRTALRDAGLRPVLVRSFSPSSVPLLLMQRTLDRIVRPRRGAAAILERSLAVPAAPLNAALGIVSRLEHLVRAAPLPFGGSLVAVATARDGRS